MKNSIKRVQRESSLSALLSARILRKAKLRLTLLAAIPMLMGFTACQQNDDFAPQGGEKELRIATRSTAAEGTTETFTRDFNLDLWSNDNPNKYERHAMHHDGTSWNVVKTNKLYDNTFAAAVAGKTNYAWFTNDGYYVDVSMDQSRGSINDYDMMFAISLIEDPSKPLDLHFEHLFVKLTFNIVYGSEYGDTPPSFSFVGIDSHNSLNDRVVISGVRGGELKKVYSSTEAHNVSAAINYGDANDYTDDKIEAIVGDGTIPAGTDFLYFFRTFDDPNPMIVKVPEGGLTFIKGKNYTFNLKVGKDKVTLTPTGTSIHYPGGWNNETDLK